MARPRLVEYSNVFLFASSICLYNWCGFTLNLMRFGPAPDRSIFLHFPKTILDVWKFEFLNSVSLRCMMLVNGVWVSVLGNLFGSPWLLEDLSSSTVFGQCDLNGFGCIVWDDCVLLFVRKSPRASQAIVSKF